MPLWWIGSLVMELPSIVISPLSGFSMPERRERRVDFPLPEGPRMQTRSPFSASKERDMLNSWYFFVTSLTLRYGILFLPFSD